MLNQFTYQIHPHLVYDCVCYISFLTTFIRHLVYVCVCYISFHTTYIPILCMFVYVKSVSILIHPHLVYVCV